MGLNKNKSKNIITVITVFVSVITVGTLFIWQIEKANLVKHRSSINEIAANQAYAIQQQLYQLLSTTYTLAELIRLNPEMNDFTVFAEHLIKTYKGISSIQLAPRGIVTKIYPLKGNEKALGHNLLKDPLRKTEALKSINKKKMTLAGPFNLVQGGVAAAGRLPVFIRKEGRDYFWGFAIILIPLKDLMESSGTEQLEDKGYKFEISRIDPDTGNRKVFYQSCTGILNTPVSFSFNVPNGEWTLSISPYSWWEPGYPFYISIAVTFFIGTCFAIFTFIILSRTDAIKIKSIELERSNIKLKESLANVKKLSGLIPICANCKMIRDDRGYWNQIELYIKENSEANFSHGLCPDCVKKLYPGYVNKVKNQ